MVTTKSKKKSVPIKSDTDDSESESEKKINAKKTDSETDQPRYYCGIGPVPKGMVRASPEYCLKTRQVRYYGIVAIDKELLAKYLADGSKKDLTKEKFKLKRFEQEGKRIIKDYNMCKLILDDDKLSAAKRKRCETRIEKLIEKRNTLVKKINAQRKTIQRLENDEIDLESITDSNSNTETQTEIDTDSETESVSSISNNFVNNKSIKKKK